MEFNTQGLLGRNMVAKKCNSSAKAVVCYWTNIAITNTRDSNKEEIMLYQYLKTHF